MQIFKQEGKTMINSAQKDRVKAVLEKCGLKEQTMAKDLYIGDGDIAADLRGKEPVIGIMMSGTIQTTGHGVSRVQDIVNEVENAMKFKSSVSENLEKHTPQEKQPPANAEKSKLGTGDTKPSEVKHGDNNKVQPNDKHILACRPGDQEIKEKGGQESPLKEIKKGTTATCSDCEAQFKTTLDEAQKIYDEHGAMYCPDCRGKHEAKNNKDDNKVEAKEASADQKVAGNVPATPAKPEAKTMKIPTCFDCGIEVSHKQALECVTNEEKVRCENCKDDYDEAKHQEAQKGKDEATKEREARPEEPKVKENVMSDITGFNLLDYIKSYVNNDVLEMFGDSGTGKSKFAVEVARQTIASGKTVFYLDTERNLSNEEVEKLKGCTYKYTPLISEISTITRQLPKVDLVIVDSIGFPILTAYARMNMKQKGDALLNMIAIFGDLKEWAYRNNSIAIVINQPESDFNKAPDHLIRPFGDKSQFAAKEIWKTEATQRGTVTKSDIRAFRSRSVGHKTLIAKMEVSDNGTEIKGVK